MTPPLPAPSRNWLHRPGIGYTLEFTELKTRFDLTRIRRDRHETVGLLTVRVMFRGARTIGDSILSSADFNCSSDRARKERANMLGERARTPDDFDWRGLLEEFSVRVLEAEEDSAPDVALKDIPTTSGEAQTYAAGLPVLRRHPTIWFGDGGCGKSLLALYAAIDLAQNGARVLFCDWELDGEDHRRRLDGFLGPVPGNVEQLFYLRCDQPLQRLVGKIRTIIERRRITFLIADSVGFACEGAPENAEAALGYFRALAQLGTFGSLHLAHMNRSEQGDQKPFGSGFWHNSARSTWYLKRTTEDSLRDQLSVSFFNRKANLGGLEHPCALAIQFQGQTISVRPTDVPDEHSDKLSTWQRMERALADGPLSTEQLAEMLEQKPNAIRSNISRHPDRFVKLENGWGLLDRRYTDRAIQ